MDVLRYAIQMECDGYSYYRRSADYLDDRAARDILRELAQTKKKIVQLLRQMKAGKSIGPDSRGTETNKISFDQLSAQAGPFNDIDGSLAKVLEKGIEIERNSAQLYHSFAQMTLIEEERDIWRRFEQLERKHVKLLSRTLKHLVKG